MEPRLAACMKIGGSTPSIVYRVAGLLGSPGLAERVSLRTPLPPGRGYAVSAATAIAASLVMAASMGYGVMRAYRIAHAAEVLESSGLGDVLAVSCGVGVVVRLTPGPPGVGEVECFQLPGSVSLLTVDGPPMHTRRLLASLGEEAWRLAERLVKRLSSRGGFMEFVEAAEEFSKTTGMIRWPLGRDPPRVPGQVGVYAKKSVIVYIVERQLVGDAVEKLRAEGLEPRLLEPSKGPPTVWWT